MFNTHCVARIVLEVKDFNSLIHSDSEFEYIRYAAFGKMVPHNVIADKIAKVCEVGKVATSATTLITNSLTRYIPATLKATIRYIKGFPMCL